MKRYQAVLAVLSAAAIVVMGIAAWLRLGPGSRQAPIGESSVATTNGSAAATESATASGSGILPTLAAARSVDPSPSGTVVSSPTGAAPVANAVPSPRVPAVNSGSSPSLGIVAEGVPLWDEASVALVDGDYDAAIPLLERALAAASGPMADRLRVDLGRALYESDQYREAAAQLSAVTPASLPDDRAVEALGLLARAHEASGQWRAALEAYDALSRYAVVPQDMVRFQAAKAYLALDEPASAIAQLEAVDLGSLRASRRAEILEELAGARAVQEDYAGAAAEYGRILEFAENADYRAQVLARQASALRTANRIDEAIPLWRALANDYVSTASAAQGVDALDALGLGGEISDLTRGVAFYGASRYAEALAALQRYLASTAPAEPDRAHYYAGLVQQSLGDHAAAAAEFEALITGTPASALLGAASLARSQSLGALGQDAATAYEQFADAHPQDGAAARALWLAAQGTERQRDWVRAAYYYGLVHTRYPSDSGAAEARFREALMIYAAGDAMHAAEAWRTCLSAAGGDDRPRVLAWLGIASRSGGDASAAAGYWQQAAAESPTSYYGLRARDLLQGRSLVMAADAGGTVPDSATTADEWSVIAKWVAGWAGPGATSTDIADHSLVQHSRVMWLLNWHAEAVELLRLERPSIEDDAGAVLSLLRITAQDGIVPFSIWAAERLVALGAASGAGDPPSALLELAYPTTYGHLISAEANRLAVDPLLFLGLVRQESRFDPHSRSWAGALGLTQVIPSTGADIAEAIGMDDYRHDMLSRPVLSVRFGVWYLSRMLELCHRDWIAAISSYNGGYGNVLKWSDGELPIADPDLFYELVPYAETKSYIRLVYENYRQYEAIYR